jgi:hypothetical protein
MQTVSQEKRVKRKATGVRFNRLLVLCRVSSLEPPKDQIQFRRFNRLFRGQNPWSELTAMRTSASDRWRPRHDKSVGVVEDDFCCFWRGWLSRGGFFFLLLFVYLRGGFPERVPVLTVSRRPRPLVLVLQRLRVQLERFEVLVPYPHAEREQINAPLNLVSDIGVAKTMEFRAMDSGFLGKPLNDPEEVAVNAAERSRENQRARALRLGGF